MAVEAQFQHRFSLVAGRVPVPADFQFEGNPGLAVLLINVPDMKGYLLAADGVTVRCVFDASLLTSAVRAAQINAANGVAGLGADGLLPLALFPSGLLTGLRFKGVWNAATNTPALASGTGAEGEIYIVQTAGATPLDGEEDWQPKDWAVFANGGWRKIDNSEPALTAISGGTF